MIATYLNQTVTHKPTASQYDAFGKPTSPTSTSIKARLQEGTKRVYTQGAQELQADAELWVLPTQTLSLNDRIEYDGSKYRVVRVDTKRTITGSPNHRKALLVKEV